MAMLSPFLFPDQAGAETGAPFGLMGGLRPEDEALLAANAREAAAERLRRGQRRGGFDPTLLTPLASENEGSLERLLDPSLPPIGMLNQTGALSQPRPQPAMQGQGGEAPTPFETGAAPMNVPSLGLPGQPEPEIPAAAKPAQFTAPPAPIAAPAQAEPKSPMPGAGFLSGLSNALASNPSTLLALGAGFAGAPSFGQGMSRAFGAAGPAIAADRANVLKTGTVAATYKALVARGIDPNIALIGATNPDALKQLMARLYPETKYEKVGPGETLYQTGGTPGVLGTPSATPSAVASGGPEKPPQGFEWVDKKDPSKGLTAIAGGPGEHLPAETAGRVALMKSASRDLPQARSLLMKDRGEYGLGATGVAAHYSKIGDIGRATRSVRTMIEAALRTMTGAAAPETEVKRYEDLFLPSPFDSPATAKQKLDSLQSFLTEAETMVTRGRNSQVPSAPSPIAVPKAVNYRFDPTTKKLVAVP